LEEKERESKGENERCSSVEIPEEQIRWLVGSQSFDVAVGS